MANEPIPILRKAWASIGRRFVEEVEMLGGNPQTAGKTAAVYTSVHKGALLAVADEAE